MEAVTYRLVVDTDKYSGNFEREMTAAATGVVGECEVGDDQLEYFFDAAADMGYDVDDEVSPFEGLMESRPDDHGCHRPCAIAIGAGGEYTAVEMYMDQRPAAKDMAFIAQRVRTFAEDNGLQILSIQFIKTYTTTVDEVLEAH